MKKSLFVVSIAVMFVAVAAFANISSALAKSIDPDPLGCEAFGGDWVVTSENSAKCVFSPDHFYSSNYCQAGYGVIDYWVYDGDWWMVDQVCKATNLTLSTTSTEVAFGEPVDAWNGNCGAFISNPPLNGSVILSKVTMPSGPNRQTICKVNYSDSQGNSLMNFGSPGWVYYNLNADTLQLWNDGQLNMYIYQNDNWQTCSNPIFVNAGQFGRVACYAENPVYFGIGTAINDTNTLSPSFLW